MPFTGGKAVIEPIDLTGARPSDVERRIIDSVRQYATQQENWSNADKNTPFLGRRIGMGIESDKLVDMTMSIERQFLTRKTELIPAGGDGSDFRFEEGELGTLRILEGQNTCAATPGLTVKMLMELGHMPTDSAYLKEVVSFSCILVITEGYQLYDALSELLGKIEKVEDPVRRAEAASNRKTLFDQARKFIATVQDPAALARSRREAYSRGKRQVQKVERDLADVTRELQEASESTNVRAIEELRSRQAALRLNLNTGRVELRVAEEAARHSGLRSLVEEAKIDAARKLLQGVLQDRGHRIGLPAWAMAR